jgi:hypothetical protein
MRLHHFLNLILVWPVYASDRLQQGVIALTRTSDNQLDTSSDDSVEVFADHAGARARAEYLATVTKAVPALTEYDYVQGTTVLQISNAATPEQAAAYEKGPKG